MEGIVFIGDEVSAAGYRLAGAEVYSPDFGRVTDTFSDVCAAADTVLITAEYAQHIPADQLDDAMAAVTPLVMVVEDMKGTIQTNPIEEQVRAVMGLEE